MLQINALSFSPLDQILKSNDSSADNHKLLSYVNNSSLKLADICDVNNKFEDLILYRYNETKTLDWLKSKVMRCASHLTVKKYLSSHKNSMYVSTFNISSSSVVLTNFTSTGTDSSQLIIGTITTI